MWGGGVVGCSGGGDCSGGEGLFRWGDLLRWGGGVEWGEESKGANVRGLKGSKRANVRGGGENVTESFCKLSFGLEMG